MINNTGQRLIVFTEQDGEVLMKIGENEKLIVRSVAQTENDKTYSPKKKITGGFKKVMDAEEMVVDLLADSPSTYWALNKMKRYLRINENTLVKDGKKYKVSDLAKDMNITRQTAGLHFKKLKETNIIAEIDMGKKGTFWAINPYYYLYGDGVPEKIAKLFESKTNN